MEPIIAHNLEGRRLIVTGASSGIGAEVAVACAESGASVVLLGRRTPLLEKHAAGLGTKCYAGYLDVTDTRSIEQAIAAGVDKLHGLDGLINCAGTNRAGPFSTGLVEHWREMVEVNFLGALMVTHAAIPHMLEGGRGDIVSIGSASSGGDSSGHSSVYAGTKAAITVWSKSVDAELSHSGLRAMVITPGMVNTDFGAATPDPVLRDLRRARFSASALGPRDVARQVVHLIAQPANLRIPELTILGSARD